MTDLSFGYALPYQPDRYGYFAPVAPLRVLRDRFQTDTDALWDTGSSLTLLDATLIPELGLATSLPLRRQPVHGIGGQGGIAMIHRIWVQLLGAKERMPVWRVEAGFVPNLQQQIGTNILGRDLMAHLRLAFRQGERRFYFDVE